MKTSSDIDRKLRERLLLAPRVEGDRLMLGDAVLLAALDGSRALTAGERAALQGSPLTTRRLRTLAIERRPAANDAWQGSRGMLRAADSGAALTQLATDDGFWRLHFVDSAGARRVILQLMPEAPFAARLLREGDAAARARRRRRRGAGRAASTSTASANAPGPSPTIRRRTSSGMAQLSACRPEP